MDSQPLAGRASPTRPTFLRSVVLAVAFGLASTPLVVFSLFSMAGKIRSDVGPSDPFPAALCAAIGAVLLSSLVAGPIGRLLLFAVPRSVAVFATVTVAWVLGILGTTLLPAILGLEATFAETCIDSCSPTVSVGHWGDLGAVLGATANSVPLAALIAMQIPALCIVICALVGAVALSRIRDRSRPTILVRDLLVASLVAVPFFASVILSGAWLSFLPLAVGAAVWADRVRPVTIEAPTEPESGAHVPAWAWVTSLVAALLLLPQLVFAALVVFDPVSDGGPGDPLQMILPWLILAPAGMLVAIPGVLATGSWPRDRTRLAARVVPWIGGAGLLLTTLAWSLAGPGLGWALLFSLGSLLLACWLGLLATRRGRFAPPRGFRATAAIAAVVLVVDAPLSLAVRSSADAQLQDLWRIVEAGRVLTQVAWLIALGFVLRPSATPAVGHAHDERSSDREP